MPSESDSPGVGSTPTASTMTKRYDYMTMLPVGHALLTQGNGITIRRIGAQFAPAILPAPPTWNMEQLAASLKQTRMTVVFNGTDLIGADAERIPAGHGLYPTDIYKIPFPIRPISVAGDGVLTVRQDGGVIPMMLVLWYTATE